MSQKEDTTELDALLHNFVIGFGTYVGEDGYGEDYNIELSDCAFYDELLKLLMDWHNQLVAHAVQEAKATAVEEWCTRLFTTDPEIEHRLQAAMQLEAETNLQGGTE